LSWFSASGQVDYAISNIPDSLLVRANSVIRHSQVKIEMHDQKMLTTTYFAITVLNKKHKEKLVFAESYHKNESKIREVKIHIYDKDGVLISKVKNSEIKDYGLQGIEFADDLRTMVYEHKTPVFPVTMEVYYELENHSPYYVSAWYPVPDFRQSVQDSKITVVDHLGGSFNYNAFDLDPPVPLDPHTVEYTYNYKKALTKESMMPNIRQCFPRLEIALNRIKYFEHEGIISDWNSFGRWIYDEMFEPKMDMELSELKTATEYLFSPSDDVLTRAKKLYQHIQATTRYVLISLEDGGWSPLAISTVHEQRYGDCKALSFYYSMLCKSHGIEADLALVNAGNNKLSANEEFYSSSQFNHVITRLKIYDQTYWVDCTSKVDPFNFLGSFTDDRNVLLFGGDEGVIIKTPTYSNKHYTYSEMEVIENDLFIQMQKKTEGKDLSDKLYRLKNGMTSQEKAGYVKKVLSGYRIPELREYSYSFDSSNWRFQEVFSFHCADEIEVFGDYLKIKIDRKEIKVPKFKNDKNRVWPIQFPRKLEYEAVSKIDFDPTFRPILEDDVMLESEFGSYSNTMKCDSAGQVVVQRRLTINKGEYSPEKYKLIKTFFDKIKKMEKKSFMLSTKT